MREHGYGEVFDVVGHYVAAVVGGGPYARAAGQGERVCMEEPTWMRSLCGGASTSRTMYSEDRVVEMHGFADVAHAQHVRR